MSLNTAAETAVEMNGNLIKGLQREGRIISPDVASAFTATPRHLFLPDLPLEDAYRDDAVFTKYDPDGSLVSSVSAPWLVAAMLELLAVRPGDRVLEIGSGGYNAALLSHLVGPQGSVTSQDIDPDVIERATRCLQAAGHPNVRLITGDGDLGVPHGAPYNRIVVTVQATVVAQSWLDQLADDGRLLVPVRLRGLGRLLVFTRQGDYWRGDGWLPCGFVRMRGRASKHPVVTTSLAEGVKLRSDGSPVPDAHALTAALTGKPRELWTGVTTGASEGTRSVVDVWLATALDVFGRLHASPPRLGVLPGGSPATWSSDTIAHMVMRPVDGNSFEYGIAWHGPDQDMAEHYAQQLRVWDRDHRGRHRPALYVCPEGPGPGLPAGRVLDRPGPRMVLTWT